MKKLCLAAAAGFASINLFAAASAATFVFKGDGGLYDSPTGNIANDCGTVGVDLCTDNDAAGFDYSKDGVSFNATAYTGSYSPTEYPSGTATQLIQDIQPNNSGLGALSEDNNIDDQTQFDSGEWIEFVFDEEVFLSNIEFNAGNDTDCSTFGSEGPCGDFDLFIDGVFYGAETAVDLLTDVFIGSIFTFVPTTSEAGFAIAQFDVRPVPLPGALMLLLSGLAGLGFATRRDKRVA